MSNISILFAIDAENLLAAGKVDSAIELCKKGLEQHPNYPAALGLLARALKTKGDFDEAHEVLQQGLAKFPFCKELSIVSQYSSAVFADTYKNKNLTSIELRDKSKQVEKLVVEDNFNNLTIDTDNFPTKIAFLEDNDSTLSSSLEKLNSLKQSINSSYDDDDEISTDDFDFDEIPNLDETELEDEDMEEGYEEDYEFFEEEDDQDEEYEDDFDDFDENVINSGKFLEYIVQGSKPLTKDSIINEDQFTRAKISSGNLSLIPGLNEKYTFRDVRKNVNHFKPITEVPEFTKFNKYIELNKNLNNIDNSDLDVISQIKKSNIPNKLSIEEIANQIHELSDNEIEVDQKDIKIIPTETLAQIYLSQGANKEAISVYKQLISMDHPKSKEFKKLIKTL